MSELKMKPVWRKNTGNGVPSDFGGITYIPDSCISIDGTHSNYLKSEHWIFKGYLDIYAYQTTRTREAKTFKVDCEDCMGSGKEIDWADENCLPIEDTFCQTCEGKGHYMELIDGVKR